MKNKSFILEFKRTDGANLDFVQLIKSLDEYLTVVNQEEDVFFKQFNTINVLNHVMVLYKNNVPVACGALKKYSTTLTEIKRMYVHKNERNQGFGSLVLKELEQWARELGYSKCILETSRDMDAAVKLYKKNNYQSISNYHPYTDQKRSCCFEKVL